MTLENSRIAFTNPTSPQPAVQDMIRDGFAVLAAGWLDAVAPSLENADWRAFAQSWNDLAPDMYMADGGCYRRRRYASFQAVPGHPLALNTHQPHFQQTDHNPLNGGVDRWFKPIQPSVLEAPTLRGALEAARDMFDACAAGRPSWDIEVHQFRITAHDGETGLPTPEGVHRDGVDFVFMMLIERRNARGGVTTLTDPDGQQLAVFELDVPGTATILDDQRIRHGVTGIQPVMTGADAHRDMLVATFRAAKVAET